MLLGLDEADENCKRFIDRALPECFKKVRIKIALFINKLLIQ